jgi:hypothetical protein
MAPDALLRCPQLVAQVRARRRCFRFFAAHRPRSAAPPRGAAGGRSNHARRPRTRRAAAARTGARGAAARAAGAFDGPACRSPARRARSSPTAPRTGWHPDAQDVFQKRVGLDTLETCRNVSTAWSSEAAQAVTRVFVVLTPGLQQLEQQLARLRACYPNWRHLTLICTVRYPNTGLLMRHLASVADAALAQRAEALTVCWCSPTPLPLATLFTLDCLRSLSVEALSCYSGTARELLRLQQLASLSLGLPQAEQEQDWGDAVAAAGAPGAPQLQWPRKAQRQQQGHLAALVPVASRLPALRSLQLHHYPAGLAALLQQGLARCDAAPADSLGARFFPQLQRLVVLESDMEVSERGMALLAAAIPSLQHCCIGGHLLFDGRRSAQAPAQPGQTQVPPGSRIGAASLLVGGQPTAGYSCDARLPSCPMDRERLLEALAARPVSRLTLHASLRGPSTACGLGGLQQLLLGCGALRELHISLQPCFEDLDDQPLLLLAQLGQLRVLRVRTHLSEGQQAEAAEAAAGGRPPGRRSMGSATGKRRSSGDGAGSCRCCTGAEGGAVAVAEQRPLGLGFAVAQAWASGLGALQELSYSGMLCAGCPRCLRPLAGMRSLQQLALSAYRAGEPLAAECLPAGLEGLQLCNIWLQRPEALGACGGGAEAQPAPAALGKLATLTLTKVRGRGAQVPCVQHVPRLRSPPAPALLLAAAGASGAVQPQPAHPLPGLANPLPQVMLDEGAAQLLAAAPVTSVVLHDVSSLAPAQLQQLLSSWRRLEQLDLDLTRAAGSAGTGGGGGGRSRSSSPEGGKGGAPAAKVVRSSGSRSRGGQVPAALPPAPAPAPEAAAAAARARAATSADAAAFLPPPAALPLLRGVQVHLPQPSAAAALLPWLAALPQLRQLGAYYHEGGTSRALRDVLGAFCGLAQLRRLQFGLPHYSRRGDVQMAAAEAQAALAWKLPHVAVMVTDVAHHVPGGGATALY